MYGTFEINPGKLLGLSGDYDSMARELNRIADHLDRLKTELDGSVYGEIRGVLDGMAEEAKRYSKGMLNMKKGLEGSVRLYQEAEARIVQTKVKAYGTDADSGFSSPAKEDEALKDELLKALWSFLNGTGTIPASAVPYLQMLLSQITGEKIDAAMIASVLNSSINQFAFFFNVAENGWKEGLKQAFGINAYMPSGTVPGQTFAEYFKQALKSELDEFTDFSSAAKTAKATAKWGGIALTGILQAVENYEEYKAGDISAGRAVAETVVETSVDVVLGIGAAAATGATLAALGVVAAPAVVIAGIAAVGVGGINTAVEYFSGKDVGEWFSDAVCDVGETVGGWFKSLWD